MSTRGYLGGLSVLLGGMLSLGQAQNAPSWTETLRQKALTGGFEAKLPPHISMVLGLAKSDQSLAVRQLAGRAEQKVHTFNVSVAHTHDVVLFLVDERDQSTVAYLIGHGGKLRKAVSYPSGGEPRELSATEARPGLAREIRYWSDFAAGSETEPHRPKPASGPNP